MNLVSTLMTVFLGATLAFGQNETAAEINAALELMIPNMNVVLKATVVAQGKDPWTYPAGEEAQKAVIKVSGLGDVIIDFVIDEITDLSNAIIDSIVVPDVVTSSGGTATANFALEMSFSSNPTCTASGTIDVGGVSGPFSASMTPVGVTGSVTGNMTYTYAAATDNTEADLCLVSMTIITFSANVESIADVEMTVKGDLAALQAVVNSQLAAVTTGLMDSGFLDSMGDIAQELSTDYFEELLTEPYCSSTTLSPTSAPTLADAATTSGDDMNGASSTVVSALVALLPLAAMSWLM